MLAVALGEAFVEADAEQVGEPRGNERSEVPCLVATFGRGNDTPVTRRKAVAQNLPDKSIHTHGKLIDHFGVGFDVGQGSAVNRLFPK